MADWGPVVIAVLLFMLLSPGCLFQLPGGEHGGGVWEHANQWDFNSCPYHYLLWAYNHLPHRHRCSHPRRGSIHVEVTKDPHRLKLF
ncbi:hypothetical protein REPUB_Repub20aG0119500 [Reevesia pubescens]